MERYRPEYFGRERDILLINWANDNPNYSTGDCRVKAIHESTDVKKHCRKNFHKSFYTDPMTLDEARRYIFDNSGMLGSLINNCVGLRLEDRCNDEMNLDFETPIPVYSN